MLFSRHLFLLFLGILMLFSRHLFQLFPRDSDAFFSWLNPCFYAYQLPINQTMCD